MIPRPRSAAQLGLELGLSQERTRILLRAGVALGLLKEKKAVFLLSRRGAALLGVPGLTDMIRHHRHFYQDLSEPIALLKGEAETELSRFWPYVFGASHDAPSNVSQNYSHLMEASQELVAHDTLKMIPMRHVKRLLDIGGGTGAFLSAVVRRHKSIAGEIFDLPQVEMSAKSSIERRGLADNISFHAGSFRDDPLPKGYDAMSLIRVLYDHCDETVIALLAKIHGALPLGGHLFISEPMVGDATPSRSGDVYFAFYTMAMQTGKARSPIEIKNLCESAGFRLVKIPKAPRPFITSALIFEK